MKTLTIRHGSEYWLLHSDGAIERPGLVRPNAATWRIVGAVAYNNFGSVVRRYTLNDILSGVYIEWQFKNGHQRPFVRDFDHGTMREWRHPRHSIDRATIERGAAS